MTIKVLVTGVGGGVGQSIMKGLRLANQQHGCRYEIIGVDANPFAGGLYRSDQGLLVPQASSPDYIPSLMKICKNKGVQVLIPGSDPEVVAVAQARSEFEAIGTVSLVSDLEAVMAGYDKWQTYQFLLSQGFSTPKTMLWKNHENFLKNVGLPAVFKPRTGSASKGLFIATTPLEYEAILALTDENYIIQEYVFPDAWQGPQRSTERANLARQIDEYSTEVLFSRDYQLIGSITNWREMKHGVPNVAIVESFEDIRRYCEKVAITLRVRGPINLQARIANGNITIFEINTRFSGSTAVRCAAGFNGPDILTRNFLWGQLPPRPLEYRQVMEIRFKNEIYLQKEDYFRLSKGEMIPPLCGQILSYF